MNQSSSVLKTMLRFVFGLPFKLLSYILKTILHSIPTSLKMFFAIVLLGAIVTTCMRFYDDHTGWFEWIRILFGKK